MTTLNTSIDYLRSAATGSTTSKSTGAAPAKGTMGMQDFLKLLTTQMQTQDPFNPVDNTQMVAQMAQFSSVAGIANMNTTLSGIASQLGGSRIGDAASWIGKSVLVSSKTAAALSNGGYAGQFTLPADATSATLSFADATGRIVHSEQLGARSAGTMTFAWDGKGDDGQPVSGPLNVSIAATGAKGAITPAIATWTEVSGVQSPAGGSDAKLITGLGAIAPSAALTLA